VAESNLTKGQQAMALALIYPEPEKGGRGKNVETRKAVETSGFSSAATPHSGASPEAGAL
jgi:hypothetical protein